MKANKQVLDFYKTASQNIEMQSTTISIREISKGYVNHSQTNEGGVFSMDGKLNIRPKYQRSYVREDDKVWCEALILSIIYHCPISLFYIALNNDDTQSMLDGQQRIITICEFINNGFSISYGGKSHNFGTLPKEVQEIILNYELEVKLCKGTQDALVKWFFIINQPNATLTNQELRNSIYIGTWTESAKKYFSRPSKRANIAIADKNYKYYYAHFMPKTDDTDPTRQGVLEEVLDWISYRDYPMLPKDARIDEYMRDHCNDENADELIAYYKEVCDFVYDVFLRNNDGVIPNCVKNTKWGKIYVDFITKITSLTDEEKDYMSERFQSLSCLDEILQKSRIAEWILGGERADNENILQPRSLDENGRKQFYKLQGGYFPNVTSEGIDYSVWNKYELNEMETHHIKSWRNGGKTEVENLVLLPSACHEVLVHGGVYNADQIRELRSEVFAYNAAKRAESKKMAVVTA